MTAADESRVVWRHEYSLDNPAPGTKLWRLRNHPDTLTREDAILEANALDAMLASCRGSEPRTDEAAVNRLEQSEFQGGVGPVQSGAFPLGLTPDAATPPAEGLDVERLARALHEAGIRCSPNIPYCRATHRGHAERILAALATEQPE